MAGNLGVNPTAWFSVPDMTGSRKFQQEMAPLG
jgi:hypothetical protein